jgi:transposase-like protein
MKRHPYLTSCPRCNSQRTDKARLDKNDPWWLCRTCSFDWKLTIWGVASYLKQVGKFELVEVKVPRGTWPIFREKAI